MSLAGAYTLGYLALVAAQQNDDEQEWLRHVDPLGMLLLGAVFPYRFRNSGEFGNALVAWLDVLRGTKYWLDVQRFVSEAMSLSQERGLPVDNADVILHLALRLERAGLDQPRLPSALLPRSALADTRFAQGPPTDLELPVFSAEARQKAEQLFSDFDPAPAYDNTCLEALATGLSLLDRARLPVLDESVLLLVALYSALAGTDEENLELLGEEAEAWALGLHDDSPLIPVTDIIIRALALALDPLTIVSHLFMLPAFTQPVPQEDRHWRGRPGFALVQLALELGHSHGETRDHDVIRLGPLAVAEMRSYKRELEKYLGRPLAPSDSLFPEGGPLEVSAIYQARDELLKLVGIHPAWMYASAENDGLLPRPDGGFARTRDEDDWQRSIDEYLRHHPGEELDHETEVGKLRFALGMMTAQTARDDHQHGAGVVALMDDASLSQSEELQTLYAFLRGIESIVAEAIEDDSQLVAQAVSLAEEWSGSDLAQRVLTNAENFKLGDPLDDAAAAFVITVAFLRHGQREHPGAGR